MLTHEDVTTLDQTDFLPDYEIQVNESKTFVDVSIFRNPCPVFCFTHLIFDAMTILMPKYR